MSRETITKCDGCATQICGDKHTINLPTGSREPDSQLAGGWRRSQCEHDLCETCRAKLCRFVVGILVFDAHGEVDITRLPNNANYGSSMLGATVHAIASVRPDGIHKILCEVLRYGKIEDRLTREKASA